MPAQMKQSIWDRISEALRKDSKKAAVLTFLVAVLGILWVRMAMKGHDGAKTANAATMGLPTQGDSASPGTPDKSREAAAALRDWIDAPRAPLGRNLFAVNLDHFPQEARPVTEEKAEVGGFWGELAKSMSYQADVRKERQILLENLQQQASQLRLQTTVMGARPKAVVNGEMVGEGQSVACGSGDSRTEFRVLKIEARRIIIEREGIRLEVPMK